MQWIFQLFEYARNDYLVLAVKKLFSNILTAAITIRCRSVYETNISCCL